MALVEMYQGAGTKAGWRRRRASRLIGALRRIDGSQLGVAIGLIIFAIAAIGLWHMAGHISWDDVSDAMDDVPWPNVLAAAAATGASYLALAGLDILALRQIG